MKTFAIWPRLAGVGLVGAAVLLLPVAASAQFADIRAGMMIPRSTALHGHRGAVRPPAHNPAYRHGVRVIPGGWHHHHDYYGALYGWYLNQNAYSFGLQLGPFGLDYTRVPYARPSITLGYGSRVRVRLPAGEARRDGYARRGDDYYLDRAPDRSGRPYDRDPVGRPGAVPARSPGLDAAVRDIENTFSRRDVSLLERHLREDGSLVLRAGSGEARSLSTAEYLELTRTAVAEMQTLDYRLDRVEPAPGGAWSVSGEHRVRADGDAEKRFRVGFVLTEQDGRWFITEVTAEPVSEQ